MPCIGFGICVNDSKCDAMQWRATILFNTWEWLAYKNSGLISSFFPCFQDELPSFSSCLLFELYQTANKNPYVQFFYKNSTEMNDPLLLGIPKCGQKCTLKKLYNLYSNILPTRSFDEECALRNGEYKPNQKTY